MPDVKVGEKIPGTYCPLCVEIGLRKMVFSNVTWAVCPFNTDGEPSVTRLKDAHTAYTLETRAIPTAPTAVPAKALITDDETNDNNEEGDD